jgi:hypothetical protein
VSLEFTSKPPRKQGLVLQIAAFLLLILLSGWSLWRAFQSPLGLAFFLFLLLALLLAAPLPLLAYRAYALYKASYRIERDGLRLNWGLRSETIPMDAVQWIRSVEELSAAAAVQAGVEPEGVIQAAPARAFPLPWLRWPGAVLGTQLLAGGERVEFLAASASGLLLIATPGGLFAVSPEDPAGFRQAYQRFAELGTFEPFAARSEYPSFLLARVWNDLLARTLLLAGLALGLVLLGWVSLVVPGLTSISLGFNPDGALREPVPSTQLLLLPLLNGGAFILDLLLGLYFYNRSERQMEALALSSGNRAPIGQVLAYLVWGSGVLTALFFLLALVFLLRAQ